MRNTKPIKQCSLTGKSSFTAEQVEKEIKSMRKAQPDKFLCRCKYFHLVIRRRKRDDLERGDD